MSAPSSWRRVLDALPGDCHDPVSARLVMAYICCILLPVVVTTTVVWLCVLMIRGVL